MIALGPGGEVLHWGAEVEPPGAALEPPVARAALDVAVRPMLINERARGWRGREGLVGSRRLPAFEWEGLTGRAGDVVVRTEIEDSPSGVTRLRHTISAGEPLELHRLAIALPIPPVATEVLDLSGRWCRERHPQRRALELGTWLRETRHGRTGFDTPLMLVAGTPGFGFRTGEVWGIHLGWSGDAAYWAERLPDGNATLAAAELLQPGEVVLGEYTTPWLYAAYSDRGLDGLSAQFHGYIRARPSHPRTPRPVVLNTWEAVYFDHDLDRLTRLAETAADAGVERFVLDDGWFRHRRDDTAGLGDWFVDETVWPEGLHPLIARVRALGMQFGLWVEPEMVNPDSDLARAHADWILNPGGPTWRGQQVLDVANPDCRAYLLERLDALLGEYEIGYLKWDHNRDLVDSPVHAQTLAVYGLLDELRERHPGVEIESCSSGGARVDLGILERTDRVWASDTNDALERQAIQRWTQLLLPPELIGSHVGPPRAHTTHRTQDLSFRVATALFGHFGFEWDITTAAPDELREAVALYKRRRGLIHSGTVVRADHPDPSAYVHGVVGDGEALFAFVQLTTSALEIPGPVRLPGLSGRVRVSALNAPSFAHKEPPPWLREGIVTTGEALAAIGLQMPVLHPEQALLLDVRS
ncbi:alpha-galactosidase [Candidatus Solirubrobacter pratensis]|uniref:alpha-galactosidase n=1 Tax=Candidatus Solirubrobacter pratensis TaxID=1298857 RepID=UPI000419E0E3|nr:alpha-galactosidase [Candidatus Solirubrobacter pratensis]